VELLELSEAQRRQYIDAEAVFTALEAALKDAQQVRGSMFWREGNNIRYLIRMSPAGAQTSLGPESPENRALYEKFMARKAIVEARVKSMRDSLKEQYRLNRALRVGRTPSIVVDALAALAGAGQGEHFLVVGTHAIYAYETACGVRVPSGATATQDIDFLFDTRKKVSFFTQMKRLDSSLLDVLRKADKTFMLRPGQLYTAVNDKGFEVDIIRRVARGEAPHPLRMSDVEDDFWAVQFATGEGLVSARRFDQVVVATSGAMARMNTVHPLDFSRVKRALAAKPDRDPLKKAKDLMQAKLVAELVENFLPHLATSSGIA